MGWKLRSLVLVLVAVAVASLTSAWDYSRVARESLSTAYRAVSVAKGYQDLNAKQFAVLEECWLQVDSCLKSVAVVRSEPVIGAPQCDHWQRYQLDDGTERIESNPPGCGLPDWVLHMGMGSDS